MTTTYAISGPASVSEGAGSLTETITRSSGAVSETRYFSTVQTQGYTNNNDYTGLTNFSVHFNAGQMTATVVIPIHNDTVVEGNETFGVILQANPSDGVNTYLAKTTFTIIDDDHAPAPSPPVVSPPPPPVISFPPPAVVQHPDPVTTPTTNPIISPQAGPTSVPLTGHVTGGQIVNVALSHEGEIWGAYNCTGLASTDVYQATGRSFFDPQGSDLAYLGRYGSNTGGQLLNDQKTGGNEHFFNTPITDGGGVLPDRAGDGFSLVGSNGHNATVIGTGTSALQPGDVFRGLVVGNTTGPIEHEAVVVAYDPITHQMWTADNFVSGQPVAEHVFSTAGGSGARIAGPMAVYRADGIDYDDQITGTGNADTLSGGLGNDTISGGAGNDRLWGNEGADRLTGGAGSDTFVYNYISDSAPGAADQITDFQTGVDHLDLSRLGLHASGVHATFTHHAGDVVISGGGADWTVMADTNGDGRADFSVSVHSIGGALTSHDIIFG